MLILNWYNKVKKKKTRRRVGVDYMSVYLGPLLILQADLCYNVSQLTFLF